MSVLIRAAALLLCVSFGAASLPLQAQGAGEQAKPAPQAAEGPGKDILTRKCFQCHQASMWNSLKQDRKAWESVLYRMVGRGALWTQDEVNAMADYLALVAGPVAPKPAP